MGGWVLHNSKSIIPTVGVQYLSWDKDFDMVKKAEKYVE